MNEQWRPVSGWPYEVSNCGRVRRSQPSAPRGGSPAERMMTASMGYNGYLHVGLRDGGQPQFPLIHRLVACAFLGPPPTKFHQTNHKDCDKTNNCVDNLEWVTAQENADHAKENGLFNARHGSQHRDAKLSESDVRYARRRFTVGNVTIQRLADEAGVDRSSMSRAISGKNWSHV